MLPREATLPEASAPLPDPAQAAPLPPPEFGAPGGSPLPPGLASGPNPVAMLQGLRRRWPIVLALGLILGGPAGYAAYVLLEPPHTAFAEVRVLAAEERVIGDPKANREEFLNYLRFQAAQIHSKFVLNAARKRDEVRRLDVIQKQPDQIAWLEDQIKVEFKEGNELLTITMVGPDPNDLKVIVNAVREAYFDEIVNKASKDKETRKLQVEQIVAEAKQALATKLTKLSDMAGPDRANVMSSQQMALLNGIALKRQRLDQVKFELMKAEAKLKTHQAKEQALGEPTVSDADVTAVLEEDKVGKRLLGRRSGLENLAKHYEKIEALTETGYKNARKEIKVIDQDLDKRRDELKAAMIDALRQKLRADYQAALGPLTSEVALLAQQRKDLEAELPEVNGPNDQLGKSTTDMVLLREEIDNEQRMLDGYQKELAELKIELRPDAAHPRVTKFQEEVSFQKRETRKQMVATAAGPVGMFLLIGAAVGWLESRRRRIHSADEVAAGLGMRVVGAVPALPRARGRGVAGEDDAHGASLLESIDAIRTLLLREAQAEGTRVVMVTSAGHGEGKTTLASHLAGSLARAGRRTLLIDCDLRRPAAHQLFELPPQPGLSETLLGEVHVAEATFSTPVDGLWLIPAGQWDREVMQALARDGVQRIFDKLRNEYDFVVLDSHPALAATDSLLIGQHADAVILSVMRGVSEAPKVYAASQRLAALGIRVVGAVVNGLPESEVYAATCAYAAPAPV